MTRAQEVFERVEQMVASGTERPTAFKLLAEELGVKPNSVRGSYYQWSRKQGGDGTSRPRRRETTPDDALADARKTLERAIENIDREVEAAKERADEARAEHDALKATATERKAAIRAHLETLT